MRDKSPEEVRTEWDTFYRYVKEAFGNHAHVLACEIIGIRKADFMGKFIDLTGQRFGKLVVVKR